MLSQNALSSKLHRERKGPALMIMEMSPAISVFIRISPELIWGFCNLRTDRIMFYWDSLLLARANGGWTAYPINSLEFVAEPEPSQSTSTDLDILGIIVAIILPVILALAKLKRTH